MILFPKIYPLLVKLSQIILTIGELIYMKIFLALREYAMEIRKIKDNCKKVFHNKLAFTGDTDYSLSITIYI